MSLSELELDSLVAEDPLDCSKENCKIEDNQENWIRFEPNFSLKGILVEPGEDTEKCSRLRTRKSSRIALFNVNDDPNAKWRPKNEKKEKRRRQGSIVNHEQTENTEKSASDSDGKINISFSRKNLRRKNGKISRHKNFERKETLVCNVCHKTFVTKSLLNEHFSNFCISLTCEDCLEKFDDRDALVKHIDITHKEKRDCFELEKCFNEEETNNHVGSSVANEKNERCKKYYEQLKTERKYQCVVCRKTFITSGHLNTHMYRHSGKKWTCHGCGKNFSCERSLIRHKDTFPGEHWFPCKFCDVTFFRVVNIVRHMEIKHPEALIDGKQNGIFNISSEKEETNLPNGDDTSLKNMCLKCLKTFPSCEILLAHKKAIHFAEDNEKVSVAIGQKDGGKTDSGDFSYPANYKCEVCSKEFVSLEGFNYHKTHQHVEKEAKKKKKKKTINDDDTDEKVDDCHSTPANFVCKICSAPFALKSALKTHLKSHNVTKNVEVKSGSHQCCICPRSFTSSDGLKYHLATHTGERRYSCNQCGKRFIKKTHLSEHIATHSEVKYFKCPRCPRTFSTHSAYRKHMKHFPGPHSFPCSKCGKLFTKESMIEKHMCVDLVKITMAPEVKALLSEDMIEEYLCLAEEQMVEELAEADSGKKHSDGGTKENTSHSCYKCFKVFPSLTSLQAHQNDHIGKQNYQCRFCSESFKRADAFGAHIRNHLGSTPYMCLKCNRKFISPFTLSMHAKNYPGDHSFICQKCQRWFPSEKRLERHECILQNSDYFTCACGSAFASWNELLQHAGTKPYKCCACELKYPTLMALARHIKKHTGVKPFSCEICGKSFRAKNNYLNHKNIHKDVEEFQCEHCDYKSKSQKRMNFHLFRKHDIGSNLAKSTLCPICGVIFPYISHMKKHVELEHGNELVLNEFAGEKKSLPAELCTLCGKMLNNKYTLANHMKKVHDPNAPKKDRKIKCEFCEEKFHTVKKLQRHAEIHEAPGLRTCEICRKEFYFANELRKHMRKHDTNKPFSCSRCGKHFKVSVSLKYHSTICGNISQRTPNNRKKREEKDPSVDILCGHIDPIDLNSQPCTIQIYGR